MTEVSFRGEWVEKSHANVILERENNPNNPEYHIKQRSRGKSGAGRKKKADTAKEG